jgi:hypothetical protein
MNAARLTLLAAAVASLVNVAAHAESVTAGPDKKLNIAASTVIGALATAGTQDRTEGFTGCLAVGAAKEAWDAQHPAQHSASWADFGADAIGCALGVAVSGLFVGPDQRGGLQVRFHREGLDLDRSEFLRGAVVGLHTVSWHDHTQLSGEPYRSDTPGLYLRLDNGATAGVLHNSIGRWGVYAGWSWSTDQAEPVSASMTVALITGYDAAPVVPLLAPSLRVNLADGLALRLITIPKWHPKQGASVVNVALEWRL